MSLPVVEHGGGLEGWWERLSPADSLSSGAVGRIPCSKLGRCAGLTPLLSHGTESTDTGLEACWGGGPGTTVPPWGRGVVNWRVRRRCLPWSHMWLKAEHLVGHTRPTLATKPSGTGPVETGADVSPGPADRRFQKAQAVLVSS